MPKKKAAGYDDALGSIFDFIFTESKKKPTKYKPPKLTGKDNSSALAKAFTEIASKPFIYFNNAAAGNLNAALGQTVVDFSIDKPDGGKVPGNDPDRGRFRVRTNDIAKFLSNPNKYWQGVFANAKAESEYAKYIRLGRTMDGAMATLWAKNNKLSTQAALDIGMTAAQEVSNPMAQKAEKLLLQNITYDAVNKGDARKIIDILDKSAQTNYTRESLKGILSKGFSGAALDNYTNQLYDLYTGVRVTGTADNSKGSKMFATNKDGKLGFDYGITMGGNPGRYLTEGRLNAFGFREITAENLKKKANLIDLNSAANAQQRTQLLQQKKTLLESAALIETISRAKFSYQPEFPDFKNTVTDIDRVINNLGARGTRLSAQDQAFRNSLLTLKQTIEKAGDDYAKNTQKPPGLFTITTGIPQYDANSVKKAINAEIEYEKIRVDRLILQLQGKGTMTAFDQNTLQSLLEKREFLDTKEKALRTLPLTDFRYNINNWIAAYGSVKENIIDGKFAGKIIDGSFFRDEGFFKSSNVSGINYLHKGKTFSVNGAMFYEGTGKPWQQLTYLYYLTPGVLVSSLINGEIPGFIVYHARHQMIESLNDPKRLQAILNSPLGSKLGKYMEGGQFKMGLDNNPKDFEELLGILKGSNDPFVKGMSSRTEAVVKFGSNLAFRFSWVKRINDNLKAWDSKVGGPIRKFIADKVLKKLLNNAAWQTAVEGFVAKNIGLLQMVRVYVQELVAVALEALGISLGGPVGAVLAFIVSELATSAVFEVGKGVLQILSIIVILIAAIFGFIFFYSTNVLFHNPIASATSYRYVVPGTALQCSNYDPDSLNYVGGGGGGDDDFPPVDSTCPLTYSPLICTQGDGTNSSAYHQLKKAMDVGTSGKSQVWYAPTDGKITHFTPVNYSTMCAGKSYGGWLEFTDSEGNVYVLLHVKAVAPIGGKIAKGHAVAVAQTDIEVSNCWTGPHFHLEVKAKGGYVEAEDWYINKLKCPISACQ